MNVQMNKIFELLKGLEVILEKSFPILPNYLVAVKFKEMEEIIDSIYGAIPQEIQDARSLMRRKESIQAEAQARADKIIADAQQESARLLSESELLRRVQEDANIIKEQVIAECEEIKRKALEDAANYRNQAHDEAMRLKDESTAFAEQVLERLETFINQHQQLIKDSQISMEKLRAETASNYDLLKNNNPQPNEGDFKIN